MVAAGVVGALAATAGAQTVELSWEFLDAGLAPITLGSTPLSPVYGVLSVAFTPFADEVAVVDDRHDFATLTLIGGNLDLGGGMLVLDDGSGRGGLFPGSGFDTRGLSGTTTGPTTGGSAWSVSGGSLFIWDARQGITLTVGAFALEYLGDGTIRAADLSLSVRLTAGSATPFGAITLNTTLGETLLGADDFTVISPTAGVIPSSGTMSVACLALLAAVRLRHGVRAG